MAIKKAREHKYDDWVDYRLCAILVKGGKVLSIGYNQRQTNAFCERYTDFVKGPNREFNISTHAEMHAVDQVRQKTDLKGCKIFVARILKNDEPAISRPCCICQYVLYAHGIRKAYYTIGNDEYGVMNIKSENKKNNNFMCHDNYINICA